MANKNDFKAFALDPNANVMSQADWEGLPALLAGFSSGKASSAQVNKAIRQTTTIAALVGQFIANSGIDALDNGDVAGLVTKFTNALIKNLNLQENRFGFQNLVVFSTSGIFSWNVPAEVKKGRRCKVTVIGGGASGGRAPGGAGGGGGGYAEKLIDLSGVDSVSITVGAGGAALSSGTSSISGNPGGTSSFGTYVSATGGGIGTVSAGIGGTGVGGDVNSSLGPGGPGMSYGTDYCSGSGGGPGGGGVLSSQRRDGVDAVAPGGGGSGAAIGTSGIAAKSGSGGAGRVIVEW
ncbi:hypothetical protein LUS38_17495 [Escherichia coli]|uniref:glycine-rich domain-containing protein n=1 Tax=Escherichia coli TaxID=562 RepID=UPI001E4252AD|nr:hypothetical protein [Escherichia coli]MCD9249003.1 hypothetical protein [Escherichia coli]HAV9951288.1 hypothetical protein [Escherichia coli]